MLQTATVEKSTFELLKRLMQNEFQIELQNLIFALFKRLNNLSSSQFAPSVPTLLPYFTFLLIVC